MSKYNKILFGLLFPLWASAQNCSVKVHGQIVDEITGLGLPYATIYVQESKKSTIADDQGFFKFDDFCRSEVHFRISHVSCEPASFFVSVSADTIFTFKMHHHEELMQEIHVHGKHEDISTQSSQTIDADLILKEANQNLGNILESIAGVSTLKTGTGVSKPIIHGLYGNRIGVLNNGLAQAGQQWGNDHNPEIDVFASEHIAVIKGVSSIAYQGASLGGLIIVEPKEISDDPHLHGTLNTIYQTNGRGLTSNLQLQKSFEKSAFDLNLSVKDIGDMRSPNYFLTNTGRKEKNGQLQWVLKAKNLDHQFIISTYNSELGILKGSQIGNLSDLLLSYERSEPFFTEPNFSRSIAAPSQKVHHHLMKYSSELLLGKDDFLKWSYGIQMNKRQEFDQRRGGRSDIPALEILQIDHQANLELEQNLKNGIFVKSGVQGRVVNNTNNPETGILPLIPDYLQFNESLFGIFQKEFSKLMIEIGARADFSQASVKAISRDLPRRVVTYEPTFVNVSSMAGIQYHFTQTLSTKINTGWASRPPAINELYSNGLHQGVSGIEYGNTELLPENAWKSNIVLDIQLKERLFMQLEAYVQHFQQFIYLEPQKDPVLTIRGAFPLFLYKQSRANISGMDFTNSWDIIPGIRSLTRVELLRGQNKSTNQPLVYMPNNTFSQQFNLSRKNNSFEIGGKWYTRQRRFDPALDILPPPPEYYLINFGWQYNLQGSKSLLTFGLKAENLLNSQYRSYLNRLRYFMDEPGRNINLRVSYKF